MNCVEISAQIEVLFDGAANPALKGDIEAHLSECPACAIRFERLQAIRTLLRRSVIPAPSASMDVQVMRAFHDRQLRSRARYARWGGLVFGSVRIPKLALPMLLVALGVALLAGVQIGKKMATQIVMPGTPTLTVSSSAAPPKIPESGVESRERPLFRTRTMRNRFRQPRHRIANVGSVAQTSTVNAFESFATVSPAGTSYSTKASLDGFQPLKDTRIRVIKGEEQR
jgi:hypothetical protein